VSLLTILSILSNENLFRGMVPTSPIIFWKPSSSTISISSCSGI
jgi:hypothetical protein